MRTSRARIGGYIERNSARFLFRRPLMIGTQPIISFTFDDFPRSALRMGGAILNQHGVAGTYYTALGLMGRTDEPSGTTFVLEDLSALLKQGHELASHTFSHCHSWDTKTSVFEDSIIQNRKKLNELLPGAEFKSFSYPISEPRPWSKRQASRHFMSCRGGGQTLNVGTADLNQLSAYFLEQGRDRMQEVKDLIDTNRKERGWLIFATHDVAKEPSRFGVTPEFFEDVVQYAEKSGARILPVVQGLEVLSKTGLLEGRATPRAAGRSSARRRAICGLEPCP